MTDEFAPPPSGEMAKRYLEAHRAAPMTEHAAKLRALADYHDPAVIGDADALEGAPAMLREVAALYAPMTEQLEAVVREHGDIIVSPMGEGLGWRPFGLEGPWTALRTQPAGSVEQVAEKLADVHLLVSDGHYRAAAAILVQSLQPDIQSLPKGKLRWRRAGPPHMVELHKPYIGARYNDDTRVWMLGRVKWCEHCSQWEMVQDLSLHASNHEAANITYFTEDTLGTP